MKPNQIMIVSHTIPIPDTTNPSIDLPVLSIDRPVRIDAVSSWSDGNGSCSFRISVMLNGVANILGGLYTNNGAAGWYVSQGILLPPGAYLNLSAYGSTLEAPVLVSVFGEYLPNN